MKSTLSSLGAAFALAALAGCAPSQEPAEERSVPTPSPPGPLSSQGGDSGVGGSSGASGVTAGGTSFGGIGGSLGQGAEGDFGGADSVGGAGDPAEPSRDPFPRGPRAPAAGEMVVLYDGNGFSAWRGLTSEAVPWSENNAEGYMEVGGGQSIVTRQGHYHESIFLHVEFWNPDDPLTDVGQDRGNSGIYLQSMFEVQVLDSFGRPPEIDGCGAIYGVAAPLVNACKPAEQWNTYEIQFTAPKYDGALRIADARFTIWLNDVLVQDDTPVPADTTRGGIQQPPGPAPLMLQDHGDAVRFRNIWWIALPE